MKRRLLVGAFWLWEAAGAFAIICLYRAEEQESFGLFLKHSDGIFFLAGLAVFLCTSAWLAHGLVARWEPDPLRVVVRWNLLPLVLCLLAGEIVLRLLAEDDASRTRIGELELLPRQLDESVRDPEAVYGTLAYEAGLGWVVKAHLDGVDGLYSTSDRGVRVPAAGRGSLPSEGGCRIALVGDSHTFGQELGYEDTWAALLEAEVGPHCAVLNLGVPGYSLGQMVLRYRRDARPWNPHVVVLALSSHSTARTVGVYGLNMFPTGIPWSQPRFTLDGAGVRVANLPLPSLEEISDTGWMSDLPWIDHDGHFVPGQWALPRWRPFYHSYLFRLYVSLFPLRRLQPPDVRETEINHELLRDLVDDTSQDGSVLLPIYLPDRNDYGRPERKAMPSLAVLLSSGLDHYDLRACLDGVGSGERFLPDGSHYSRSGSAAVAGCVRTAIDETMGKLGSVNPLADVPRQAEKR